MRLEHFTPTYMVERIYDLTVEDLKARGIKTVLADLSHAWLNL